MTKHLSFLFTIILLVVIGNSNVRAQYITTTLAGNNYAGYAGDGGYCTDAKLNQPTDVCMDAAHNIYIADNGAHVIRKIDGATGIISTYAGGGYSYADGIQATNAVLDPWYMCLDAAGNLYVTTSNKVMKIRATTHIITTVAGTGTAAHSGDGGPATAAEIYGPSGICIDAAGNLYMVEGGAIYIYNMANGLSMGPVTTFIRKVTAATGRISTLAGTGTAGYSGDGGPASAAQMDGAIAICVNTSGDIFFSDQPTASHFGGGYLRKISSATVIISTIAGTGGATVDGGLAMNACIGNVYGMCFDTSGDLYIDDVSCSCRKIDMTTGIINTIAGSLSVDGYNGTDSNSRSIYLNYPNGLSIDDEGNIFVADSHNERLRKIIRLAHTPAFTYNGQFFNGASSLNSHMAVADLDSGQTETWTVLTPPLHGVTSGFPATAISGGSSYLARPSTPLTYVPYASYTGKDSFSIMVSDGTLSDTVMVHISATGTSNVNVLAANHGFSIFPNPATSVLNMLWIDEHNENVPVVISDVTGREFYRNILAANNARGSIQLDISSFPTGIYIVSLNGGDIRKFVKQ